MSSTLDLIKNTLGYATNPGPIRQALNSSTEVQAALDSSKAKLRTEFSSVFEAASQRVAEWKEAHPEGLTVQNVREIRQNLPGNGEIAAATLEQLKTAFQSDLSLQAAVQNALTPEIKTAAIDGFHSRVSDWKAAAADNLRANVADWKASTGISEQA